jgi:hypothetical protein
VVPFALRLTKNAVTREFDSVPERMTSKAPRASSKVRFRMVF